MPSFDTVLQPDLIELRNAVEQSNKEIGTRFDFKGSDARFTDFSAKLEKLGGDKVKQPVAVKTGIDSDAGKRIQSLIKQSKLKLQASIQGDAVRITGTKRDDLQSAIALLKREVTELPLGFDNFRD